MIDHNAGFYRSRRNTAAVFSSLLVWPIFIQDNGWDAVRYPLLYVVGFLSILRTQSPVLQDSMTFTHVVPGHPALVT